MIPENSMMNYYTNKTYKVDKIDYNKNPASTLKKEYFKERCEIQ